MTQINKYIDHTMLKATATKDDILKLIEEAKTYDFKSVCVNPYWVNTAYQNLLGTDVLVCTVIGFPLGANSTKTKVFETLNAIENGADEIDMVQNVGEVLVGNYDAVYEDVLAVKNACGDLTLKVILETCYLTDEQIKLSSEVAIKAGADFIKTSTGFGTGGATIEAVKLMKSVNKNILVKASGGVKSLEDLNMMVEAGASRIGASSGVAIMNGLKSESDY
jgi:deoxyribose-phosphate aldolase